MAESFLSAASERTDEAMGIERLQDLSIEGNDPASWGGLVFGENRKAHVKAAFEKAAAGGRLALKDAWALVFVPSERAEYDFDTFDTDLQATCEGCKEDMSWDDVQKFFDENL